MLRWQASSLLKYSVDVFKDIVQTRPNKVPIINYILAKLQAKYVRQSSATVLILLKG